MGELRVIACWCAPPGKLFIIPESTPNCTWPECPHKEMPDPAIFDRVMEVDP